MPVQASGSNVFVNLPVEVRNLYGIKKGDMLVLVVDPTSATPLVISDIEKAAFIARAENSPLNHG